MSMLLALLGGVSLRAWLVAGGVALAAAGAAYFLHASYKRGEAAAVTKIERANNANQDTANRSMDAIERCYASGGDWDRAGRVCVGPGPGK